jgi:hypothetical protein
MAAAMPNAHKQADANLHKVNKADGGMLPQRSVPGLVPNSALPISLKLIYGWRELARLPLNLSYSCADIAAGQALQRGFHGHLASTPA